MSYLKTPAQIRAANKRQREQLILAFASKPAEAKPTEAKPAMKPQTEEK